MDPLRDVARREKEDEEATVLEALQAAPFLEKLVVSPWGILGSQMTGQGEKTAGPSPDDATAILDPTSLAHVQGLGPRGSMGASGAIYELVGLDQAASFPADVVADVQHEHDAKHHRYGSTQVIHTIGPDLRGSELSHDEDKALEALAEAYTNVLAEFVSSGCARLRLLPLSGGFFSGPYHADMPGMTLGALCAAFARLDPRMQRDVLQASSVELCIFAESDFEHYGIALHRLKRAMHIDEGEAPSSSRRCSASLQSPSESRGSASAAARRKSSDDIQGGRGSDAQAGRHVSFGGHQGPGAADAGGESPGARPDRRVAASSEGGQCGAADDGQPVLLGSENAASETPKASGRSDIKGSSIATVTDADHRRGSSANSKLKLADDDDDDVLTEMLAEDGTFKPLDRAPAVARVIKAATVEDPCDSGTEMLSVCGMWRKCKAASRSSVSSSRLASTDKSEEAASPCSYKIVSADLGMEQVKVPPRPPGDDIGTEVLSQSGEWQPKAQVASVGTVHDSASVAGSVTEVLSVGGGWQPRARVSSTGCVRSSVAVANGKAEEQSEDVERRPRSRISNAGSAHGGAVVEDDVTEVLSGNGEWRRRAEICSASAAPSCKVEADEVGKCAPRDDGTEVLSEGGGWRLYVKPLTTADRAARVNRMVEKDPDCSILQAAQPDGAREVLSEGGGRQLRERVSTASAARSSEAVGDACTEVLSESGEWRRKAARGSAAVADAGTEVLSANGEWQPRARVSSASAARGSTVQAGPANGAAQVHVADVGVSEVLSASGEWRPRAQVSSAGAARGSTGQAGLANGAPRVHVADVGVSEVLSASGEWRPRSSAARASTAGAVPSSSLAQGAGDARAEALPEGGERQPAESRRRSSAAAGAVPSSSLAQGAGDARAEALPDGGDRQPVESRRRSSAAAVPCSSLAQGAGDARAEALPDGGERQQAKSRRRSSAAAGAGRAAQADASIAVSSSKAAQSRAAPKKEVPLKHPGEKRIILDPKSVEGMRSIKWKFGEESGAWIFRLGSHVPREAQVYKGDILSHINGVYVRDMPRAEIQATWRSEQHRLPWFYLDLAEPEP